MDGNFAAYNYLSSARRIDEILNQPSGQFEETDSLPDRDKLTFTNGYYGRCSAIFVDIRDSSGLTAKHKRPALAKLYRSFISEMVAVLNGTPQVREVSIVGDCVWAVYNTPYTRDIDEVFGRVYVANTLKKLLNIKLGQKGYESLNFGIGVDWGRALMIKAGYSGSGINDVIYMGDVVNRAAHLAHNAGRGWEPPIWVGESFFGNLKEENAKLLSSKWIPGLGTIYVGEVVETGMEAWLKETFD